MVKALVGVAVLLGAATLAVAIVGNPFNRSARPASPAQEFAAAARAQCGGEHAATVCVRLVSEKLRSDHQAAARAQCGGRRAEQMCIRLVSRRLGLHG